MISRSLNARLARAAVAGQLNGLRSARYNRDSVLFLIMVLVAGMGLTGCLGSAGAPAPSSKATTQASSNQLPGRQALQSQNDSATAPVVTAQPASQVVLVGQSATFSVAITGTIPISYQWNRNGAPIGGATSASYTTAATTSADNGATFSVVVSNSAGSVTSNNATLTVSATAVAPVVTVQPTDGVATAGQGVTFSVAVSGTSPLSYQWREEWRGDQRRDIGMVYHAGDNERG